MTAINSFSTLLNSVQVRTAVVPVELEDGKFSEVTVREMNGAQTMELMRRSPNTIQEKDGRVIVDNSTSQLDMALVVAYCAVEADNPDKPLNKNHKAWNALPARVIQPLFEKAIEISGLGNKDESEEEGNDAS